MQRRLEPARVDVLPAALVVADEIAAAGAVVDGSTFERIRAAGKQPEIALRTFDAYPVFDAIGDAIITGPSGNNVRDLRILISF